MNSKKHLMFSNAEKWNRILHIVNQHPHLVQPNLTWQLKKLFIQRLITENLFIFILQYIGLTLSTLSTHLSIMWLATGTACAYIFLRGYSVFPGIWLGTFSAYFLAKSGFWVAFGCATVLSLQVFLILWFNYRYLSPTLIFYRLLTFAQFIVFTFIITGIASMVFLCICYSSMSHQYDPFQLWLQWWFANFNAILIFSCALITFDAYFLDFSTITQWKKILVLFGLLFFLTLTIIVKDAASIKICMAVLIVLLTAFISFQLGWCGAITSAFISGILLMLAGFWDASIFYNDSHFMTLVLIQLFLCINALIGLSIAIKIGNNKLVLDATESNEN